MHTRRARLFNLAWLVLIALPSFGTAREGMNKQYYSLAPMLGGVLMAAALIATLWAMRTVFATSPDRFVHRTFLVFAPIYAIEATLYIGGLEWITVVFWLAVAFMLLVNNPRFLVWARSLNRRRRVA